MKVKLSFCCLLVLASLSLTASAEDSGSSNWPAWRGPVGTGVAPLGDPPITWSETNHIRWKIKTVGQGTATPVIWGDQVILLSTSATGKKVEAQQKTEAPLPTPPQTPPRAETPAPKSVISPGAALPDPGAVPTPPAAKSAEGPGSARPPREGGAARGGGAGGRAMVVPVTEEQQLNVISYDRRTGKVLWEHSPRHIVPHEGHHKDHGFASASPVTDGDVLIASFGSRGIFGYDLKGTQLWQKDLGQMKTRGGFGEGSSPALSGDVVVVVWDHDGPDDFIVALDKRTGKELWRQPREEDTNWSTPLIVEHAGKKQVVVNGGNRVRSYDLTTGAQLWEAGGQTKNVVPAPVAGHGRVYVMSGWKGAALQAITLGRSGDLTGTDAIAWSHSKNTPYVPSPLLYGDWLYFYSNNNAQLSIFNAQDGSQQVDAERLEGVFGVYASPVGAAGRVYLLGRDGNTWVIKNGPKIEVLAKNKLEDGFDASPAVVGKDLFLRGREYLYALADDGT